MPVGEHLRAGDARGVELLLHATIEQDQRQLGRACRRGAVSCLASRPSTACSSPADSTGGAIDRRAVAGSGRSEKSAVSTPAAGAIASASRSLMLRAPRRRSPPVSASMPAAIPHAGRGGAQPRGRPAWWTPGRPPARTVRAARRRSGRASFAQQRLDRGSGELLAAGGRVHRSNVQSAPGRGEQPKVAAQPAPPSAKSRRPCGRRPAWLQPRAASATSA